MTELKLANDGEGQIMIPLKKLLDTVTVRSENVEELSRNALFSVIEEHAIVRIQGLIQPEEIKSTKAKLREAFRVENDHPATGESPTDLHENYQKFSIGDGELRDRDFPKCLRTFYNPIWADDLYSMQESFLKAAQVRNLLMGFPLSFAVHEIEDGFWTASRIHHYPAGGGFMGIHKEDYIPTIYEQFGVKSYYQPLIIMSKRGPTLECDYQTGGGFFEYSGNRYYYEEECELGDVVVYDTRILHGVAAIDPNKPFRQNSLEGRFSGLVTMYRDFSQQ